MYSFLCQLYLNKVLFLSENTHSQDMGKEIMDMVWSLLSSYVALKVMTEVSTVSCDLGANSLQLLWPTAWQTEGTARPSVSPVHIEQFPPLTGQSSAAGSSAYNADNLYTI